MNTPAHAILNLWALGRRERPETVLPIVIGSVVADLPIVLFYAWAKLVQGLPEDGIWSQAYFAWQGKWIIDLLHSLPVTGAALLLAWLLGRSRLTALFASMVLHVPGDFFLHHDDAHRHLFPFSDWRFHSPVSYWDPRHYGQLVAPLEIIAVLTAGVLLFRRYESREVRTLIAGVMALYAVYFGFVLWMWV